jgi:outer membrane protein TolC
MKLLAALAVFISVVFAGEACSGEGVSLDIFLDMVISNNNMLLAEEKSVEAAYFAARSSVAHQRPSFAASVAGSYLSGLEQGGEREDDIGGIEINLGVVQPIDISGKFGLEERQAVLSLEMRRVEMEGAVNGLLADAEERYWSAIFAAENTALQKDILRQREENRRIAEWRCDLDLAPRLDVIRADALVSASEAVVAQAEAELLNILAEMASMTGGRAVEPVGSLPYQQYYEEDSGFDADLERRPDVRAAVLSLRDAATARDLAAREMSPTLEASASWIPYSDTSGSGSSQTGEVEASLRLNIPILDGGAAKSSASAAAARIQSAEARLKHIRETAGMEIAVARNNRNLAVVTERAKRSEVEKSNEELRVTELMYREGLGAQIDLINAHMENQRARSEHLTAVRDICVSAARLRRAAGDYAARFPARD